MIVFIAVPIECQEDFDYLAACSENLQRNIVSGRFVRLGNMHVTLVYLGETDRIEEIEAIMDEELSGVESFLLTLDRTGSFSRGRSSTIWVGGKSERLTRIYDKLYARLAEEGFEIEPRSYKPHITLARNVVFSSEKGRGGKELEGRGGKRPDRSGGENPEGREGREPDRKGKGGSGKPDARKRAFENPPHVLPVERITLFSSEQADGRRFYRALHSVELSR